MRARYDKGEPYTYLMSESTDRGALFFDKPIQEIKFMMKHTSMVAEFVPFNSSPAEFRFDLTGLEDAVKPLREGCSTSVGHIVRWMRSPATWSRVTIASNV